jgi:diguanylate cyclase (GGDEF)-like protein/PAS domain S-box-containing protein
VLSLDTDEKRIIEQISATLMQLLRGEKAKPVESESCPESLERVVKYINEIVYSFSEIWDFILPLSQGILNIEPPRARNLLASPFKELHSQLRALVWQVQQVAKGDYKQRVVFMGEFSDAFNNMVEALEEKDCLINEHIRYLENEAQKLRESEARYASAVRNSPGGIYIFDPHTMKIIESNEQFNTMMGYSKEEISKLTVYDFYADKLNAQEDLENILKKSLHNISNRQYCLKNGGHIEVDIYSCWSASGHSNVIIVSIEDVTQRNKAQEIAAKYRVLLENARDIILFVGLDGQIAEANKAAEDAYGYSRDELLLMNVFGLHRPNDRLIIEKYMKEASRGGITYETVHIRKDGTPFPVEVSSQQISIGKQIILGKVIRDISDRKRIEDNLRYFASYDSLTRVPNRRVLEETYIETYCKKNQQNKTGALLLIDVDNFKFINDMFGHTVGDMVLVDLVSILKENLSNDDFLARFGGDEFCILLNNVTTEYACMIAEKLRCAVEQTKMSPGDYEISLSYTISIGVAPIYNGELKFREIISRADYALYQSKEQGRNRVFCVCDEQLMTDKITETNNLMFLISNALEADGFVLFFQPIVDISSGETIHHEALMRIVTENGDIVYPGKAIPIAERFGLMSQIDKRIIKLSFEALEKYPDLKLFVNLSGASIGNEELLLFIEENIQQRGIEPSRLGFEITETVAVKDLARADRWIRRLRDKGCEFALDDFGIGFSSFSYLQYLSVDFVKIDGSYIHNLDKNYKNRALVQAMNTVARSLGKEVIAEFVEKDSILSILREDKIGYAQGYFLGHPEPIPKPGMISAVPKEGNKY